MRQNIKLLIDRVIAFARELSHLLVVDLDVATGTRVVAIRRRVGRTLFTRGKILVFLISRNDIVDDHHTEVFWKRLIRPEDCLDIQLLYNSVTSMPDAFVRDKARWATSHSIHLLCRITFAK